MTKAGAAFLFGSGISRASGCPSVEEITESVLSKDWHWDGGVVVPGKPTAPLFGPNDELGGRTRDLIRLVHARLIEHLLYRERRLPTYEDHFSCLSQIVDDEMGEFPNPPIRDFSHSLRFQSFNLWNGIHAHLSNGYGNHFASLSDKAIEAIQHVVHRSLAAKGPPVGFGLLSSVFDKLGSLDIFSLNHDLLIEDYLDSRSIHYADGFGKWDGDAKPFSWSWNKEDVQVRLFKLHGSIDWYRLHFKARDVVQYAKTRGDPEHAKDSTGTLLLSLDPSPYFVTGTTFKELSYGRGISGEVFAQFKPRLREHHTLFCSGYGWGDIGINARIAQWLHDDKVHRVVILHGKEGEDLKAKRFWQIHWDKLSGKGKVVRLDKWFSQCSYGDIAPYLQPLSAAR